MKQKITQVCSTVIFSVIILSLASSASAQDIFSALEDYESGRFEAVRNTLLALENTHYDQPEFIFLNALLESDGEQAFALYSSINERSPDNPLFEHTLWRMCQYFYAKELYGKCSENITRFQVLFPDSDFGESAYRMQQRITGISAESILIKTSADENPTPQYVLQFGAFGNESGATTRLEYLRKLGLTSSIIQQQNVGNKILYKIWVGNFTSREEAEKKRNEYRRRFRIPDVFVVDLNK